VRVLHLVDRWAGRGGAYRHLEGVLGRLERAGHTVAVAAGESAGQAPSRLYEVPGLDRRTREAVRLEPAVADFRPDLVHLHTVLNPAVLEWAASVPAVITIQDHRYFCPAQGKWTRCGSECRDALSAAACADCFEDPGYFRERLGLTDARLEAVKRLRVVVLSRYMARELEEAGVKAARINVVPPFADLPAATAEASDGQVAIVGRLAEGKGVREAVAVWREARVALPLVAAGTGPMRRWLEDQGVAVTGWLDRGGLSGQLARTRAVIMTPRWQEPFGIAGLEALAAGVPVAAWRSGGIEEWHPGPLPEWGDVAAVAARLTAVLAGGAVPADVRSALRARFDPDRSIASLVEVYRRVVGLP